MSFASMEISELREDSEDDYALEIQTGSAKLGVLVTEEELEMLGDGIQKTLEGTAEDADGLDVRDYGGDDV